MSQGQSHFARVVHRPWRIPLEQRLADIRLIPGDHDPLHIHSSGLVSANEAQANEVRFYQVGTASGGSISVVEKSLRKLWMIPSLESRFYRHYRMLADSRAFQHPRLYGVVETPLETHIYTERVDGKGPSMPSVAVPLAAGIAELEIQSRRYIRQLPVSHRVDFWHMDFFRPWFTRRSRFNFQQHLPNLTRLETQHTELAGYSARLGAIRPILDAWAARARQSARCICHLDYLKKNLFVTDSGLHLIDWSAVKVGRIGFDAGAYLSSMLRRLDVARFTRLREEFEAAYQEARMAPQEWHTAQDNLRYLLVLNGLWQCLRPDTLDDFVARKRLPRLVEKYDYLIAEAHKGLSA